MDTVPHVVHLNVGGVCFVTRRQTLVGGAQGGCTFFSGLVNAHPDCCELFVDRDPTHFRHVLNWLRGVRFVPDDEGTLRELVHEADYFCMQDFKEAIANALPHSHSIPRTLRALVVEVRECGLSRE